MRSLVLLVSLLGLLAGKSFARSNEEERLEKTATVIGEILDIPDGMPQELLDKAECILVLPSVKKFAIGIGGSYGKGAMVCRSGKRFDGPWGAPSMYRLEGGNIGFQLGVQATDFVFLVIEREERRLAAPEQSQARSGRLRRGRPQGASDGRFHRRLYERRDPDVLSRQGTLRRRLSRRLDPQARRGCEQEALRQEAHGE